MTTINVGLIVLICILIVAFIVSICFGIVLYFHLKKKKKLNMEIKQLVAVENTDKPVEEGTVNVPYGTLGEYPEGIIVKKETTNNGKGYVFYKVRIDGTLRPLTKTELVDYLTRINRDVSPK